MCGKQRFLNSESRIRSFPCVLSTTFIGHMVGGNSGDNLFKREVREERFYCESHRGCFPFVLSTANIGHMALWWQLWMFPGRHQLAISLQSAVAVDSCEKWSWRVSWTFRGIRICNCRYPVITALANLQQWQHFVGRIKKQIGEPPFWPFCFRYWVDNLFFSCDFGG